MEKVLAYIELFREHAENHSAFWIGVAVAFLLILTLVCSPANVIGPNG